MSRTLKTDVTVVTFLCFLYIPKASLSEPLHSIGQPVEKDAQYSLCESKGSLHVLNFTETGEKSGGILSLTPSKTAYTPNIKCAAILAPPVSFRLLLSFMSITTRSNLDNVTVENNVTLSGVFSCPAADCDNLQFLSGPSHPNMTLIFASSPEGSVPSNFTGLNAVVTVFNMVNVTSGHCDDDGRFKCANGRCVWKGFRCDGVNHCGDASDEDDNCSGGHVSPGNTAWGVVVIVLGFLMLCFFLPLFTCLAFWGGRRFVSVKLLPYQPTICSHLINDSESDDKYRQRSFSCGSPSIALSIPSVSGMSPSLLDETSDDKEKLFSRSVDFVQDRRY
ncbi:uncharacterized protein LOC111089098 [Limulus polyphemus]|uniref:Uncharacterized protein LOC111089098 n=1 Tax=Limulus polyphemus TaxID=6850 RepID=A0ABM1TL57_LIMPO|nr:uncharacterized protein LOC111089098 [Limulus polyphemus]